MPNINNDKTTINFIWCINAEKWGTMEKIIAGKELEIEDIIPNFAGSKIEIDKTSIISNFSKNIQNYNDYYYAQTIASWAINYPENAVRLIYHPLYIPLPVKFYNEHTINDSKLSQDFKDQIEYKNELINHLKNTSLSKIPEEIRNFYEKKIQQKYYTNLSLNEIEQKYINTFKKFEEQMHGHGYKNFQVISYQDLVKNNLSLKEAQDNLYLQETLNNEILGIANYIEYLRIAIGYFGFGYEKNLSIDMDITPKSMNNRGIIELDKSDLIFTDRDATQLIFTGHSYLKKVSDYIQDIEKINYYNIFDFIKNDPIILKISTDKTASISYYNDAKLLPEQYRLKTVLRYGGSHIKQITGKSEPIFFEKNYWPQDNKIELKVSNIERIKSTIEHHTQDFQAAFIILLIFLPFIILGISRIVKYYKQSVST